MQTSTLKADSTSHRPDRAHETELLRIVLGKMGAHAGDYQPVGYAVWYEYVRGSVPPLQAEVDALLRAGSRLSPRQTQGLFDRHLRDRPETALANARAGLLALLSQVQTAIGDVAITSAAYDTTLRSFEGDLARHDSGTDLQRQLDGVLAHTNEIRTSITTLGDELNDNKAEVGRLTDELKKLREDVLTDPLTGLANRRGFDVAIAALKSASDESGEAFSIVMLDIDHFKRVNDTHGHLFGDRVIQQVATTMRSCVRGGDTAARYGGEEFALLLPSTAARGAATVAEYIGNALQKERIGATKQHPGIGPVTVSSGVATYRLGESVEACIGRADQALYAAKHGGRNRVSVAG